jgi:hypothetical protein
MPEQPNVEERMLALEERKLSLEESERPEKLRSRRGEFLKANLATILAFLTSIASLLIAYRSMQISEETERRRSALDTQRLDLEIRKAVSEAAQDDRKWHMDLLDFSAKNRDLIFGADEVAKQRIKNIMIVTFPSELVGPLFEKLEQLSPKTTAWKEGAQQAQALSPLKVLTSRVWKLRVVYGQNENRNLPSVNEPDDIYLKFGQSSDGYSVWRVATDKSLGNPARVAIAKTRRVGQFDLEFTREDLGNASSPVNCKRAYSGRGALFHLMFDSINGTLGGSVDVARPDAGNPPYKCADAQLLPI